VALDQGLTRTIDYFDRLFGAGGAKAMVRLQA